MVLLLILSAFGRDRDSRHITHRYGKDQLKIKSLSESDFMKHLELAIQFGAPFLFENVDEELDPMLDPVLVSVLCRGAFTLSLGLVSHTRCRGWFLFGFWGHSDRVERPRRSAHDVVAATASTRRHATATPSS